MTHHLNTDFLIADGSRARWIRRSPGAQDFETVSEFKAAPRPRARPQGVVFEAAGGQRFNVEERHDAASHRRLSFAEDVAEAINDRSAKGGMVRLVIVAPARMSSAIGQRLSPHARARLVATVDKDLTKTRDHELGAWLASFD